MINDFLMINFIRIYYSSELVFFPTSDSENLSVICCLSVLGSHLKLANIGGNQWWQVEYGHSS